MEMRARTTSKFGMRTLTLLLGLWAVFSALWGQNPCERGACQLWTEDIGPVILAGNDDGSVGPIDLPFPVPVYGQTYTRFWINNNGNVTFTGAFSGYTAFAFPNNQGIVIIAPFFADVDTRPTASGKVHYRATDEYVVITWNSVGYYSWHTDKLNRFQLIITRDGYAGFSYAHMEWTTGDASGGSGGFGGSPARAGFDAGNGRDALVFWEGNTPESLQQLCCRTRWFNLRTGQPAEDIDPPDTIITEGPEDGSLICVEPIRFRWTGVDDATPTENLDYRWRLDGGDWSEWTSETSVDLTGLSEGEHTFEVQARDAAGRIDETPASRTFRFRNDPNPPQISNLRAEGRIDRATIQWNTDEPATSQVEYRLQGTTEWQRSSLNTELGTEHSITLTGLQAYRVYEYRALSRDECGNEAVSEIGTFRVDAADLTVTVLQVPQEIWNDTQFDITWQVQNAGTLRASNWSDTVYFSRDDRIDGSDYFVGVFPFAGDLEPGQAVSRTQVVSVPRSRIDPEGTYYLIVFTDSSNVVPEGDREDNNRLARSLVARRQPLPDLTVPQVQAPASAFFGQTIEVRWQVRNGGQGATQNPWYDRVVLASDAGGTNVVGSWEFPNESALGTNEGYLAVRSVTIPRGLVGRYYLIVATDARNQLLEEDETNNRSVAQPIDIAVPPLPDLVVPQVVAPAQSYAGQTISVRWRVENRGARDIPASERGWHDSLYLSQDTQLDASDRWVASRWQSGNLQPGEGYTVADFSVTVPRDLPAGEYYLLVLTDATNSVYEFVGEANNLGVSAQPIQILATPPNPIDLIVEWVQVEPTSGFSGDTITVRWQVINDGADPAPAPWVDAVYLSTSPTLNREQATRLGTFSYPNDLPAGESYEASLEVRLPDCLPAGQYYLFVYTDDTNRVVEYDPSRDAEANNTSEGRSISTEFWRTDLVVTSVSAPSQAVSGTAIVVSWTVANQGDRDTPVSRWTDRVRLTRADGSHVAELGSFQRDGGLKSGRSYTRQAQVRLPANLQGDFRIVVETDATNGVVECDAEDNNRASAPIQLLYGDLPNLQVSDLQLSTNTIRVAQSLTVRWTVANTGQAGASGWTDGVYISPNPNLNGAHLLTRIPASQALSPGQSYSQQVTVTIPVLPAGDYYIVVVTDDMNRVFEGDQEGDNTVALPIQVGVPVVNLTVEGVDAPAEATAGYPATFTWVVRNQGTEATYAPWIDGVILSRDLILDPTDIQIGTFRHTNPLGAGESRTVQVSLIVPAHLTGPYYVFVVTDRANELIETDETDNRGVDTQAMVITVAPPADLIVVSVDAPNAGSPGVSATIRWTVRNQGSNTARASWYDSVYLSADDQWDINDVLIGRVARYADLAPGESYTAELNEPLPGVLPGSYRVIVRTDARNTVRETNETNNSGVSAPIVLDVIELTLGTPFANTLTPNARNHFYKVNVPAGQTLLWQVDVQNDDAETELFVRYGDVALRSAYDYRNERPFGADQEAVVPRSQAGYYYGLVHGADVPANAPYQTVVRALPFGIREVTPNLVGNAGFASLRLKGAQLDEVERAFLVLADGTRLYALRTVVVSPAEVIALFSMVGVPSGTYTVGVQTGSGAEAFAENALQVVEEPSEPPLIVQVSGPDTVRPNAQATYYITVYNGGRNDALGVVVFVRIPVSTAWHIPTLLPPTEEDLSLGIDGHHDSPEGRVIALLVPIVPAGGSTAIPLILQAPSGGVLRVEAFLLWQLPAIPSNGLGGLPGDSCFIQITNALLSCVSAVLSAFGINIPGGCAATVIKATWDKIMATIQIALERGSAGSLVNFVFKWIKSWVDILSDERCVGQAFRFIPGLGLLLNAIDCAISIYQAIDACRKKDKKDTPVVAPRDPNEKHAPSGYGEERFIPAREPVPYTVLFENLPTATAYARQVVITDQLDPNLDWRTFEVDSISFRGGRYTVQAPPGSRFFQTTIQMREEDGGLQVRILAGIDLSTGGVTWRLTAIDPNTGEPPTSPLLGLLPPNNDQHEGEGLVTFRVRPKRNLPTGTVVRNGAVIVFDEEEPIATNEVFNTLDAVAPSSTVAPLPSVSLQPEFFVQWSGSDDAGGSGLRSYTVWVSVDGSPFTVWLNDTQATGATFTGEFGRRYAFYVSATDNAGNLEPAPSAPEASVLVLLRGDVDLNGCVDDYDLLAILFAFGSSGSNLPEDLNSDGVVDDADLNEVLAYFGAGCR